jgi:hypothetical protein
MAAICHRLVTWERHKGLFSPSLTFACQISINHPPIPLMFLIMPSTPERFLLLLGSKVLLNDPKPVPAHYHHFIFFYTPTGPNSVWLSQMTALWCKQPLICHAQWLNSPMNSRHPPKIIEQDSISTLPKNRGWKRRGYLLYKPTQERIKPVDAQITRYPPIKSVSPFCETMYTSARLHINQG